MAMSTSMMNNNNENNISQLALDELKREPSNHMISSECDTPTKQISGTGSPPI